MAKNIQRIDLKTVNDEPVFRIGLFEGQDFIDFRIEGKFNVENENGEVLIKNVESDLKWRIKIKESRPGKEHYFLILYEALDEKKILEKLELAREYDPNVQIRTIGGDIYLNGKKLTNNTKYLLVSGDYASEIDAKRDAMRFQPRFSARVEKETLKQARGELEVFDAEYEYSAETDNVVRIVPHDYKTKVHLYNIRSFDEILGKELHRDHFYNGTIEFRIDNKGSLMAISELPLETYLKRVVYSEIGTVKLWRVWGINIWANPLICVIGDIA